MDQKKFLDDITRITSAISRLKAGDFSKILDKDEEFEVFRPIVAEIRDLARVMKNEAKTQAENQAASDKLTKHRALKYSLIVSIILPFFATILPQLLLENQGLGLVTTSVIFMIGSCINYILYLRKGNLRGATVLQTCLINTCFGIAVFFSGATNSHVMIFAPLLVVTGGFLTGKKGVIWASVFQATLTIGLTICDALGIVPIIPEPSLFLITSEVVMCVLFTGSLIWFYEHLRESAELDLLKINTSLKSERNYLKQIMEALDRSSIVAYTDPKGRILEANDNFCKISGYNKDELIGKDHRIINSGQHPKKFFADLWATISAGKVWRGEIQNRSKGGQLYIVYTVISPLSNPDGKIEKYMAIRFDVTKEKESMRLLEEAQHVAKIGSWTYDLTTKSFYWSKQMFELHGESPSSSAPSFEKRLEYIHPEDRDEVEAHKKKWVTTGIGDKIRFRIVTSEKNIVWLESITEPVVNKSGELIQLRGTSQDVTELVALEAERAKVMHSAKLASLGEMSAGIAHEINNPISVISGTVRVLPKFMNDPKALGERIQTILNCVSRVERIISGLKKFSRTSDKIEMKVHSICEIIREAITLTEPKSKRHNTPITVDFQSEGLVVCDEIEIEQVVVNLINNAIDAVEKNPEKWIRISVFEAEKDIFLEIKDSGSRISTDLMEKIFQPFFTTKPVGQGTGLGLAIVKGILDEHGATIEISKEVTNMCFVLKFPKNMELKNAS